ncbi:MAG: DNA repair protein RadA [Candidatus Saccharimonadales bacterium]
MAKTIFICQECGANSFRWSGKCSSCNNWNTLIEEVQSSSSSKSKTKSRAMQTKTLADVSDTKDVPRISSGIDELDQVFGGGIVPGSVTLLAGEPGVGKSTLLLQLSANIASLKPVLYVSGEESMQQIKLRADRLGVSAKQLELLTETDIDTITATIESGDYAFVVVDSIQTMQTDELSSSAGTISQITACTHKLSGMAKSKDTAVLVVGHVTKEGNIAGPKILEHLVDVVMYLEGERFGSFKMIRGNKNRYGSTNEVGIFEMTDGGMSAVANPSERFLQERTGSDGSVVLATIEGTRALLVEVQALVSTSPFGYPKRTAVGFDLNRLNLLIAVLQQRAGLKLADKDVYINIVGGMKLAEPAADLAIALAIASAANKKPLKKDLVVYGEVGLSGEIRSVSDSDKRNKEAAKLKFSKALAPSIKSNSADSKFVLPVKNLSEAIDKGLET